MKPGQWLFNQFNRKALAPYEGKLNGPSPSWPLGNAGLFIGKNPWEAADRLFATYDQEAVLVWMGSSPALLINSAQLFEQILDTRRDDFYKDAPRPQLLPFIGDTSCFIQNGKKWQETHAQNPMSQAAFPAWLARQVALVRQVTRRRIATFAQQPDATPDDSMRALMERLTFDVFCELLVGTSLSDKLYHSFVTVCDEATSRLKAAILLPILNPMFYVARSRWFNAFDELLRERDVPPNTRRDSLLHALFPTTQLSRYAFYCEVANLFPAGSFSTTSAFVSAMLLLQDHPAALATVRRAVQDLGPEPDWHAIDGCKPLEHVLFEAMRLYPGAPFYTRNVRLEGSLEFAGVTLPKNTTLYLTPWALQRDKRHWGEDANEFRPSRWTEECVANNPPGSGYFFPFGRGPRSCLGEPMALFVMKTILATFLAETDVIIDTRDHRFGFYFACLVHEGLTFRVRPLDHAR